MDIENIRLDTKKVRKSARKVQRNEDVAGYYFQLSEELRNDKFINNALSVLDCYKYWDIDHYKAQRIKDVKRIQLCKDRFCNNCQNVIALRNLNKFKSVLDDIRQNYDIYHIVVTVPNVDGPSLNSTLDKMYAKFPYLIQYLKGDRQTKDINFTKFGYVGAIRSLEITTASKNGLVEYHPHFHCLFVLRKGLDRTKKNINEFSFNRSKRQRLFTDNEIFLQKVWYLLYNGKRLNKRNVEDLKQGYSVIADDSKGRYHEVFKYALKGTFKDNAPLFTYEVFKTVYSALYRRKIIQGYGILNKYKFDTEGAEDEIDKIYNSLISSLQNVEQPEKQVLKLSDVLDEFEKNEVQYISKNSIRKILKSDN